MSVWDQFCAKRKKTAEEVETAPGRNQLEENFERAKRLKLLKDEEKFERAKRLKLLEDEEKHERAKRRKLLEDEENNLRAEMRKRLECEAKLERATWRTLLEKADAGTSFEIAYGKGPSYWNERYTRSPGPYDWLARFEDLKGNLARITSAVGKREQEMRVLHVGCGNSLLAEEMYDAGYTDVVSVDNSTVVINQMKARHLEQMRRPELRWVCMDATAMTFGDARFDLVVDKSLLDTFACCDNSKAVAAAYLKEVTRVLVPGGFLMCVSFSEPERVLNYLKAPHLDFFVHSMALEMKSGVKRETPHYVYVCLKGVKADERRQTMWPIVQRSMSSLQ